MIHELQYSLKAKYNKKELPRGVYKPHLTLSNCNSQNGLRDIILRIELSLPKFLFGNSFQELRYKDFLLIIKNLVVKLESMGVVVNEDVLANAPVGEQAANLA